MKKIIIPIVLLLTLAQAKSQIDTSSSKSIIRTAADLKSGNSQDVLTSFFQFAVEDLMGNNKTFKFQSSLFAIKCKTDSTLMVDTNYLRQTFARNFIISIAPQVDSNFKFKGSTIGFKYAIINNRDNTVFDYAKALKNGWDEKINIKAAATQFYNGNTEDEKKLIRNYWAPEATTDQTKEKQLPVAFKNKLQELLSASDNFKNISIDEFVSFIYNRMDEITNNISKRGLLTIDANGTFENKENLFSKLNFNLEYLKGMSTRDKQTAGIEINAKATVNMQDDMNTIGTDINRQTLAIEGGINWILLNNKNKKSVLELKTNVAYNEILKGLMPSEEKSNYTFNGNFRIRITDKLWLPFEFKHDLKGNLFGFISLRSNFDWLNNLINKKS